MDASGNAFQLVQYRSRSLPPGYSFRFVRSLGRILLCHDNGVVVSDTPEVREPLDPLEPNSWGRHLSFLYGPLDIFLDLVERTTGQLLEVEPSSTVGMAGCIPVLVPSSPRAADLGDFGDLARALDPSTAAPAPDGHGPLPRHRSEVPARAPTRPKGSGLEVCLEQANSTLGSSRCHVAMFTAPLHMAMAVLSDGATPLIYALDRLRKTPWDCSKSLMSLNSCIVRLIENQADLNALVPPDQESPLQLLLRASHTEGELVNLCKSRLAVLMIRSRAEVNHLDRAGASPLSEAAMAGDVEMCRLLLDHGATVSNLGTAPGTPWLAVALKLDPLNPELLLASAEATFVSGDFDKAYRALDPGDSSKVVALCPLNGLAYELCARSLWHLDRMGEALCVCRSMVPSNVSEKSVLLKLEGRMEQRARAQRWLLCPPVPDHYEALGVKKNVNQVQLKKAYRHGAGCSFGNLALVAADAVLVRLAALRWHPDKNVGQESMAEQAFKQIQQAFEVLSDERLRKDYDDYPGDRKPWKFGKRNGPGVSGG
eukprot:Skav231830  [mRNA]  locus=scaffold4309:9242:25827:+ [translate_table: standard]